VTAVKFADLQLDRTWQYAAYLLLSLVALIFTVILLPSSGAYFRRFFGETNAIIVIVLTSVVGAAALWGLQSSHQFALFMGKTTLRGVALSAALATVLAIAIVVADFFIRYPQDTNVPVPQALLFYPAVGFVAEIIFHVLPLALLLLILNPLGAWLGRERVVWLSILLVAILEPTFQVLSEGKAFTLGAAYTWIHVFAIAFLQLYVYRRFDFMSMYSFRLFYYAYWHILWGVIRLEVLF
jgi:uncharacterized membrane protein YwzB